MTVIEQGMNHNGRSDVEVVDLLCNPSSVWIKEIDFTSPLDGLTIQNLNFQRAAILGEARRLTIRLSCLWKIENFRIGF